MARFTSQTEFSFGSDVDARAVVPDSGTSLTFEVWSGTGWVTDGMSPITEPQRIFTRNVQIRLTPNTGGFLIDEGGQTMSLVLNGAGGGNNPVDRQGREISVPTQSPFANVAARDTWALANLSALRNTTAIVTHIQLGGSEGDWYRWSGTDQPTTAEYNNEKASSWEQISQVLDEAEAKTLVAENLTNGKLPMITGGTVADSIATQDGVSGIQFDGTIGSTKDTVDIGGGMSLSEDGTAVRVRDKLENRSALAAGTILNSDKSTGQNVVYNRTTPANVVVQSTQSDTNTGNLTAWFPITSTRIINDLTARFGGTATKIRLTMRDSPNQTTTDGIILYQSHTDAEFAAGNGFDVSDANKTFTFENSAKLVQGRFAYLVVEQHSSGVGTLTIKGHNTTISGVTQFYPYLEQLTQTETLDEIALKSDMSAQIDDTSTATDKAWSARRLANYDATGQYFNGANNQTYSMAAGSLVVAVGTDDYQTGNVNYLDLAVTHTSVSANYLPVGILQGALSSNTRALNNVLCKGVTTITLAGQDDLPLRTPIYVTLTGSGNSQRWELTHQAGDNSYFIGRILNDAGTNEYYAWIDFAMVWAHHFDQSVDDTINAEINGTAVSGRFDTLNFIGDHIKLTANSGDSSQLDIQIDPGSMMIRNGTGGTTEIGQGAELGADNAGNEVALDVDGANQQFPTMWANGEIANGSTGEFIRAGTITGTPRIEESASRRATAPIAAGTALYYRVDGETFSTVVDTRFFVVGNVISSAYRLNETTAFDQVLQITGSAVVSTGTLANQLRNRTVVLKSAAQNTSSFEMPNLNLNQEYTTPFQVGDQVAFTNRHSAKTLTINQASGGNMQDISGNAITSYTLSPTNGVVFERIAGNIWKHVSTNQDIILSDIVVEYDRLNNNHDARQDNRIFALEGKFTNAGGVDSKISDALKGTLEGFETAYHSNNEISVSPGAVGSVDGARSMTNGSLFTLNFSSNISSAGGETASTWYYLWIHSNNNLSGSPIYRFDTNGVNPVVPGGYTRGRVIGAVFNDSSSNIRPFWCFGHGISKQYVWQTERLTLSNQSITNRTAVNCSEVVPIINGGRCICAVTVEYSGSGNMQFYHSDVTSSTFAFAASSVGAITLPMVRLNSSGNFHIDSSGTNTGVYLKVQGFTLELGG